MERDQIQWKERGKSDNAIKGESLWEKKRKRRKEEKKKRRSILRVLLPCTYRMSLMSTVLCHFLVPPLWISACNQLAAPIFDDLQLGSTSARCDSWQPYNHQAVLPTAATATSLHLKIQLMEYCHLVCYKHTPGCNHLPKVLISAAHLCTWSWLLFPKRLTSLYHESLKILHLFTQLSEKSIVAHTTIYYYHP